MKKLLIMLSLGFIAALGYSCKEEDRQELFDAAAPAPAQVQEVQLTRRPGGALLTYKIPADPNFLYAKASYEIRPGVFREAKASRYTDTLALVGYGDTLQHEVKIYSVGKNEKESSPLSFHFQPLRAPVQAVSASLQLLATFGGVQVAFQNPTKASLAIELMVEDPQQKIWTSVNTFYTGAPEGSFSARGFAAAERKFAVYLRDRWHNKSDTLIKLLTPVYEEAIAKDTWKALRLPTDTWQTVSGSYALEYLWDERKTAYVGIYATPNNSVIPQWFTIDLGKKVIISRIRMHHQEGGHLYKGSAVKRFELWGSNNPSPDGSWDNWEKLGTFQSFKPSGLPMGTDSQEDKDYGHFQGEEFTFDHLLPEKRYIRWKTLESYGSAGQVVIAELDLYGQIKP